jgi:hypothetical protein
MDWSSTKFFFTKLHLAVFFIFLLVGFLSYSNSLHNGFMIDDHAFFDEKMRNIKFLSYQFIPDKDKFLGIRGEKTDSYYRPLAHVIPMMCYLAFRDNPFGYHLVNLILFCLAAYLIYLFVGFLFQNQILAFLTGLLYLVHPINGVFVNYITANVFAAEVILLILSLMCLWLSWESKWKIWLYSLSLLFFAISLLCHETAMAMPFYVMCLLFFVKKQSKRQVMLKSLPFFLLFLFTFYSDCIMQV